MIKRLFAVVAALIILPLAAGAAPILVGPGDLTGSRTTPDTSGVVAADGWTEANGGFKIAWDISKSGNIWTYTYGITNKSGGPLKYDLSHWMLEVSSLITEQNVGLYIWGTSFEGPRVWTPGGSNPDMPGNIYGIKFEPGDTVTFQSTQSPIWGDFYAKDGRHDKIWATAWNTGFGTDPDSSTTNFTNWIPTPDTGDIPPIPEPGTLLLLGSGLAGLAGYGKLGLSRRRK